MLRPGEEDLSDQRNRLTQARAELAETLASLEAEAKTAKKRLQSNRDVDLSDLHALVNGVKRGEEACDMARYDLDTASGEDG